MKKPKSSSPRTKRPINESLPAGLLVVDKPLDWTSNDVVQKVKRLLGARKVGHTGTLDPAASGVLVLCLNQATRWATELVLDDKVYEATVCFGERRSTGDVEGEVLATGPIPECALEDWPQKLAHFVGLQEQQVPSYSAVKVDGRPLYQWSRQGIEKPRPWKAIEIFELTPTAWQPPELQLRVHCSKGTYIRQLAEDIGTSLETQAYLSGLRRTQVGNFNLKHAVTLEQLQSWQDAGDDDRVLGCLLDKSGETLSVC